MKIPCIPVATSIVAAMLTAGAARADGTPPPDLAPVVATPTSSAAAPPPAVVVVPDQTTASLAAGGLASGGNSTLLAANLNGKLEIVAGRNAYAASVVGNYGQSAPAGSTHQVPSIESLQTRMRYDRYLLDPLTVFLVGTYRHDRFQGLALRANADPGFKLFAVNSKQTSLWAEAGYDFQFDIRNWSGRQQAAAPGPPTTVTVPDPDPKNPGGTITTVTTTYGPVPAPLALTATDHSARGYLGWKQVFTPTINLAAGVEYLQSVVHERNSRVNFDALLTANVIGGIAVGVGFVARYDNGHLPSKQPWDTSGTLSIIYSFSETAKPPAPPPPSAAPAK